MADHDATCACCSNPGFSMSDHLDGMIAESGVGLQPVFGSETGPGFMYTTGLSEKGGADVIFVGDCSEPVLAYMGGAIDAALSGVPVATGRHEPGTDLNPFGVPMWIVEASDKLATHAFGATSRVERIGSPRPARLLQVVMPDREGRFPWDAGYDWLDQRVALRPEGASLN